MKHNMTLFVADRNINEIMKGFDLRPAHKWYVTFIDVMFTRQTISNSFFLDLIEESKKKPDYWIPAIKYKGKLYKDQSVKELSDGYVILFLPESCISEAKV